MRAFLVLVACFFLSALPAFAGSASVVLTDVPYFEIIPIDFQCEFEDITDVEITMTSYMGPVYICGENIGGPWSYPCGNLTRFNLGDVAYLRVDGLGEIDSQSWSDWVEGPIQPGEPMTDWSFLNSGTTHFILRCFANGCSPEWIYGESYCGPYVYEVDEVVITVHAGTVGTDPLAWGQVKSLYR